MYKHQIDIRTNTEAQSVFRTTDNFCIPFDPDNTDYQAYLKWLEEGNTPEPADEPTQGA